MPCWPKPVTTSPGSSPISSAVLPGSTVSIVAPRTSPVVGLDGDAQPGVLDRAVLDQLLRRSTCAWSIGMANPRPMLPDCAPGRAAERRDRRVDADQLAVEVDQRATGVAGVDGCIGLDRVEHGLVRRRTHPAAPAGSWRSRFRS